MLCVDADTLAGDNFESIDRVCSSAAEEANIGSAGIDPALLHLTRYRGAANIVVLLDHHDVQPGLCQVGSVGQAVMARADDNCVVFFHCNAVIAESHAPRYAPVHR